MANYWMHNGFLQVEGEKMSKSEGNFVTIHELLHTTKFGSNKWHGYVLRLAMLMTHYRQPIDWTVDRLVDARETLRDWIDAVEGFDAVSTLEVPPNSIVEALSDDLNFPEAMTALHGMYRRARSRTDADACTAFGAALRFLGLWRSEFSADIYGYGIEVGDGPADADVRPYIEARDAARKAKNFKEADRIRDELAKMHVTLKDSKDPKTGEPVTTWEYAR